MKRTVAISVNEANALKKNRLDNKINNYDHYKTVLPYIINQVK